ncbi:MAG: S-layer protein [Holophagaceae bacterium]|nr:S-layer protein [Holophagaceae bacterium]
MNKKSAILALTAALCAGSAASAADSIGDRFHYFGIMGNRYDHMEVEGRTDLSFVGILNLGFKINDHMSFETTSELHKQYRQTEENQNLNGSSFPDDKSDWTHLFENAYVNANWDVAKLNVKAGRFRYDPAYGISHGDYLYVSGAQVGFSPIDQVRLTLTGGQNTNYVPGGTFASMGYMAAEAAVAVIPKTANVKLSFQRNQSNLGLAPAAAYAVYDATAGLYGPRHDSEYMNYFEGGFDTKLPMNFSFEGCFIKSSYDTDNKGTYAQLKYGNAIPFVPGTFDIYAAYHNLEGNSIMWNDMRYYKNMKGRTGTRVHDQRRHSDRTRAHDRRPLQGPAN